MRKLEIAMVVIFLCGAVAAIALHGAVAKWLMFAALLLLVACGIALVLTPARRARK